MSRQRFRLCLPLLAFALAANACTMHWPKLPPVSDPAIGSVKTTNEEAIEALDHLEWYLNAYGFGSISSPLLVQPDDSFKFNLTQVNADTFFNSEKNEVSGRLAGLATSIDSAGVGLGATVDPIATQQYLAAVVAQQRDQSIINAKQRLLNSAAFTEYQAAVQAAMKIADPAQRAQALATARTTLAGALSGPAATDSITPPTPTVPDLSTLPQTFAPDASSLLSGTLAGPQGLFASGTPSTTGETRAALMMAAGDNATYAILSLLGDPQKMIKYNDKRILFGVSMVSLTPGWNTREGFAADISVSTQFLVAMARPSVRDAFLNQKLGDTPAEKSALADLRDCVQQSMGEPLPEMMDQNNELFNEPDRIPAPFDAVRYAPYIYRKGNYDRLPLVSAISPMADAQALDLQSSIRRQREMALQLSFALRYAGLNAQAQAFDKFAQAQQVDAETRTENVVVEAYSAAGGVFGYQIGPRVSATPGSTKRTSSYQLDRQSFPTLIVFGVDDEDLRPRVMVVPPTRPGGPPRCIVGERRLHMRMRTNWRPLRPKDDVRRLTERDYYRATIASSKAVVNITQDGFGRNLYERAEALRARFNGPQETLAMPADLFTPVVAATTNPTADTIVPSQLVVDRQPDGAVKATPVQLMIAGDGLDQIDITKIKASPANVKWLTAFPGGTTQVAPNAKLIGKTSLLLVFQVTTDDPVIFTLPVKNSKVTVASAPLVVRVANDYAIQHKLDDKGNETLTFSRGVSDAVIKSAIEKDKPHHGANANVKVDVNATDQRSETH